MGVAVEERDGGARRDELVALVEDRPGQTTSDLADQAGLSWSTTRYHLRRLQNAGALRQRRFGRSVRYFPCSRPANLDEVYMRPHGRRLLELLAQPRGMGITQAARALACSAQQVRRHVRLLESAGIADHGGQYHKRYRLTIHGRGALKALAPHSNDSGMGATLSTLDGRRSNGSFDDDFVMHGDERI